MSERSTAGTIGIVATGHSDLPCQQMWALTLRLGGQEFTSRMMWADRKEVQRIAKSLRFVDRSHNVL